MLQPTMRLLFWIAAVVFCKVIEGGSISGEFQYCSIHCADKPNTATKPLKQELKALSKPRDCYDIKFDEPTSTSGVYTVYLPDGHPGGIEVFCDMETDAGGWLVFQKRFDGSVDFFRSWDDYTVGFGNLSTEFWLGLNSIQKLTSTRKFHLRVDLSDFEENTAFAQYSMFHISEGPDFRLSFDQYSGTAGSALEKQKFSTKDKDQDDHSSHCAVSYFGAWWYGSCHSSNLNGKYLSGTTTEYATGMVWNPWKGYHYSLKTAEMKIRPYYD